MTSESPETFWISSSSFHACALEVWLHVWLCSIKTKPSSLSPCFTYSPGKKPLFHPIFHWLWATGRLWPTEVPIPYSSQMHLKRPQLSPVMFTSCLSPSLSAKAGWIILLHVEFKKINHLVVSSFTNLNKALPRLKYIQTHLPQSIFQPRNHISGKDMPNFTPEHLDIERKTLHHTGLHFIDQPVLITFQDLGVESTLLSRC